MRSASVEVLGMHASLMEQGSSKEPPVVWGDSSSALQMAHRQGTGRLKRVEVSETVGHAVMCLDGTFHGCTESTMRGTWQTC